MMNKKLSEAQQEILEKMSDGWKLHYHAHSDNTTTFYLKRADGRPGSIKVHPGSGTRLMKGPYLMSDPETRQWSSSKVFVLTSAGREAIGTKLGRRIE
jgi:hypothetical protein